MSYVKIGVAGPVGSGKTALIEALSRKMAKDYSIGVITNAFLTFSCSLLRVVETIFLQRSARSLSMRRFLLLMWQKEIRFREKEDRVLPDQIFW